MFKKEEEKKNPKDSLRPSEGGTPTIELVPSIETDCFSWCREFLNLVARQTGVKLDMFTATNITDGTLDSIRRSSREEWWDVDVESQAFKNRSLAEDRALQRAGNRIDETRKNPPIYATNPEGWTITWIYDRNGLDGYYELRICDPRGEEVIKVFDLGVKFNDVDIVGYDRKQSFGFKLHGSNSRDFGNNRLSLIKNGKEQTRKFGVFRFNETDKRRKIAAIIDSLPTNFTLTQSEQ